VGGKGVSYAKGLSAVPYPIGSPEWQSFLNYVKVYYKEVIHLTHEIAGEDADSPIFRAVLNSLSSPLVFLWEKWQLMSSEQRLAYATPEYVTILKRQMGQVEETVKRAEERGAFQEKRR
jgi:hypothetical protein